MTTATMSDADRYLKELTPHLAALPPEERAELLEDLALHLQEVAAEPGPPLEERLGPPAAYAAELLASAGFASATAGAAAGPAAARSPLASAVAVAARVRRSAFGREVARAWPSLRPAWWVARAWVAVYLLVDLERDGGRFHGFPFPELFGNPFVGFLALAVAIPASIRLGQKDLAGWKRAAVVAGNVVLVFYALSLAGDVGPREVRYVDSGGEGRPFFPDSCLRNGDGSVITNLYAHDADGRLLDPVLLYDQFGRPIDNLCPEYDGQGRRLVTEYRRDANGAPVINAFPRRQGTAEPFGEKWSPALPGRPDATVPVTPPAVVAPRLSPPTTALTPTTTPTTTTVP